MYVSPVAIKASLGFDMALPLQVRLQAGHLINEMLSFCFLGRNKLPNHRSLFWPDVCGACLCFEYLIDCLTWRMVNPISTKRLHIEKSPTRHIKQFFQLMLRRFCNKRRLNIYEDEEMGL